MGELTRRGICYNLNISPYTVKVEDYIYYFSSKLHKDKFISRMEKHREECINALHKKWMYNVNLNGLYDLVLYERIETRGFKVTYKGMDICRNIVTFGGEIQTPKN